MTIIADLSYNGKEWVLNITPEDNDGEMIEIPITDEKKKELENIGLQIYNPEL